MATPFREGKVWSFRLRIKSEDVFQTGFATQAAARKAMEDQRQALKSEGKPAHRGPWRTNVGEALAQYARERLPVLKGAVQDASRINRYLRAAGLNTIKLKATKGVGDASTTGIVLWVVEFVPARTARVVPQWLSAHRQAQAERTNASDKQRRLVALKPVADVESYDLQKLVAATDGAVQTDGFAVEVVAEAPPVLAVPEPMGKLILEGQFGIQLVDALSVAFITKSLVILTGAPGSGKSWIASRLLDDTARDRTVIVPVASTWRGREDLLGYVNPINGSFEATEFTHFLCDAQEAWEAGDKRARLVIFEEFNLSQPEHWLSDLLVRLEYDANQIADRTVRLGGKEIAGRPGRACSVVLVPNLRFAATLNNDHTVKPLSPRVLDRAALIEVTSSGRAALSRAGVELGDDLEDVIDELNDLLEPRGAAFSVRSARSLQRAMEASSTNGMGLARALDLVLVQEVLSRVRLLAGDPRDEQLHSRLQEWTQKPGCTELVGCAARIADWADFLSAGRDVFQA